MKFLLSDEQLAMADGLETLLAQQCPARRVHQIIDGDEAFEPGLWQKLLDFGVASVMVSEEYGGLGLELIDLAIIAESLGQHAAPVPFLGHVLATLAIAIGGSDAQRQRWLPRLAAGEVLATVALGEGDARWRPEEWTAGLTGQPVVKHAVPHGAEAKLLVVGMADGGLGLVEADGIGDIERLDATDRTRPIDRVTLHAGAVEPLPGGQEAASRLFDAAAVLLAADAFGGGSHCLSMSVAYAKEREQYGRPIGSFQAVKHQLADMALRVEPGRGLYWYAAHAYNAIPDQSAYAAAQAKAHVCDAYLQAARDSVEAHGGIGFTWEHDAHIYLKRAIFDWAWLGQPSQHRQRAADLIGW